MSEDNTPQNFLNDLYDLLDTYDLTLTSAHFARRLPQRKKSVMRLQPLFSAFYDENGKVWLIDVNTRETYSPKDFQVDDD